MFIIVSKFVGLRSEQWYSVCLAGSCLLFDPSKLCAPAPPILPGVIIECSQMSHVSTARCGPKAK